MTPAEKDAAVLEVLPAPGAPPMSPSVLAALVAFVTGAGISDDSVRRSLKRIGAVRHPGGRYSAPLVPAADAERPKALPAYVCSGCHKRKTDYAGSRAKGSQRVCWACVERS